MIDAREYLESIKRDELRIGLKVKLIQNLHDQLCSISGSVPTEQVSHTRNVSAMADTVATIIDMQNEIDHQANEVVKRKHAVLPRLTLTALFKQFLNRITALLRHKRSKNDEFP